MTIDEFKNIFKNNQNFEELINLKIIFNDLMIGPSNLTKNMLDYRGNKIDGWSSDEKRGNKEYKPPIGLIGFGLKVLDKYEKNIWIGNNNSIGEWPVAYHGVGTNQSSDHVKTIVGLIYRDTFKIGKRQAHNYFKDIYHPGKKVGNGVYCMTSIQAAEAYAGISEINDIKYKTVLMARIKPEAIGHCKCESFNWVVNGTTDEIRPYRILFKKYE